MGLIGKEILRKVEAVKKSIHEQKAELMYLCVRKTNSIEITVIILIRYKKCKFLQFRKEFKIAELLPEHYFFVTLETVLKMAKETNKGDAECICASVTATAS